MTQAYPLAWPQGRPRRRPQARKPGKFGKATWREGYGGNRYSTKGELSVADATRRLQDELDRLLIARDAGLEILAADAEGLAVLHPDGQVRRYALVPAAADTPADAEESPEAFAQRWKRTEVAREAAVSALMKEPSDA